MFMQTDITPRKWFEILLLYTETKFGLLVQVVKKWFETRKTVYECSFHYVYNLYLLWTMTLVTHVDDNI